MTKDLTTSNVSRQNILNNEYTLERMKLHLDLRGLNWHDEDVFTKAQVAQTLDIDEQTIENYIKKNNKELKKNGYQVLKTEDLKDLIENESNNVNAISETEPLEIFSFKAVLNIAMLVKDSEKADQIRNVIIKKPLNEIAQDLKIFNKKVQLIYAFNGTGKTRLSREFKNILPPDNEDEKLNGWEKTRILYYNAFTEDLFYWDNDLESDLEIKLQIQSNSFTDWVLRDRGQDRNIIENFQRYTDDKLTPSFIEKEKIINRDGRRVSVKTYPEVEFSYDRGTERTGNIKISKGEESNLIWSVFYTLLKEVTSILDEPDPAKRDDNQFDKLEYVFIDDPVSSLDDNHLIQLAVDVAGLIKSSKSGLKFIITTHSPLFYNILCNEFNNKFYEKQANGESKKIFDPNKHFSKLRLEKMPDGLFSLHKQPNDSPFSYHLLLLSELQSAIESGQIRKYHFNFLRNILEKMATFLGYNHWPALLPKTNDGQPDPFINRILNLSSHSAHSGEEISEIIGSDKAKLEDLVIYLIETYGFNK